MNEVPTPPGCESVPFVVDVPSPQSMVAVKSLSGALGLPSVNEATGPLNSGGVKTGTGYRLASTVLTTGWAGEARARRRR